MPTNELNDTNRSSINVYLQSDNATQSLGESHKVFDFQNNDGYFMRSRRGLATRGMCKLYTVRYTRSPELTVSCPTCCTGPA